jgi:hypothetical protein
MENWHECFRGSLLLYAMSGALPPCPVPVEGCDLGCEIGGLRRMGAWTGAPMSSIEHINLLMILDAYGFVIAPLALTLA